MTDVPAISGDISKKEYINQVLLPYILSLIHISLSIIMFIILSKNRFICGFIAAVLTPIAPHRYEA